MLSAVSEVRLVPLADMGGAQARQLVDAVCAGATEAN
jgi:hypothetical protein